MKKLRSSLLTFAFLGLMTVVASAAEGGVKEKTLLDLFEEGVGSCTPSPSPPWP